MKADVGNLLDLFKGDLLPELKPYLRTVDGLGKFLHHPLVVQPLMMDGMCGHANRLYEQRTADIKEATEAKNWGRVVFSHERAYRIEALERLIRKGDLNLRYKAAWQVVSHVWTDSENVDEHDDFWRETWAHPNARKAMTRKEEKALAALPDVIPVWHGLEREDPELLGFSWTTSQTTGEWFADRFARIHDRRSYLAKGFVHKSAVKSYLLGRNESEIIAFPRDVEVESVKPRYGAQQRNRR